MKKRMSAVLLAAMSACSALTPVAFAYNPYYDEMETEQNGYFYARKYEPRPLADAVFQFSHSVYNENTGGFSCNWDGVFLTMAEVGWSLPEAYAGKSYKAFPGLSVTYDADFYTDSNSYFGIHGCTRNPLTEYYIIEGWGSWRPPGEHEIGRKGTVTVGGKQYDLYYTLRYNAPSIDGPRTYPEYYCVRQNNTVTMGVQNRVAATVDVYGIFQQMENAGLDVCGELESCGLFAESYGGELCDASGSFTVHSASRSWNDGPESDWFLTDKPPGCIGDANCDGIVDVSDCVLILRFCSGDTDASITDTGKCNADCNHDDNLNDDDSALLLRAIAKLIELK